LGGLLGRMLARFQWQLRDARIKSGLSVGHIPLVYGDERRLEQVFSNLIDNAVRHTPADGTINVSAEILRTGYINVGVHNTGSVIPADDLPRVFERFFQVDRARARRKELVPVLGVPLLEYRLRNLREHGVHDIVLACSQGMREVEEHFGDGASLGVRIEYAYEDRPLGSGRAVKEAARAAGASGTLVVCNGDILTNVDLTAMIERHSETGATLSISLAAVEDPWHFGVVEADQDLRGRHFVEKPPQGEEPSNLINA